jgi:hypothetical protein
MNIYSAEIATVSINGTVDDHHRPRTRFCVLLSQYNEMSTVFKIRGKHSNYELARDKESDAIREIKEARETSKFRDSLLECKRESSF